MLLCSDPESIVVYLVLVVGGICSLPLPSFLRGWKVRLLSLCPLIVLDSQPAPAQVPVGAYRIKNQTSLVQLLLLTRVSVCLIRQLVYTSV